MTTPLPLIGKSEAPGSAGRLSAIHLSIILILILAASGIIVSQSGFSGALDTLEQAIQSNTAPFVDATGTVTGTLGSAVRPITGVFDTFQPGECGPDWDLLSFTTTAQTLTLWISPTILIITIVCISLGAIYMAGQFFNSPQLIAIAKDEAIQNGMTLLRVIFIAGALFASNIWFAMSTNTFVNDPVYHANFGRTLASVSMIDAAMAFCRQTVSDMVTQYGMLLLYNSVVHALYSTTLLFGISWRSMYSFNMGPILKPIIDVIGMVLQMLSLSMSEWLLHIVTLCIIKKWTWTLLIPLGMLLRAFPFSRSAGESLLTLTMALAIFYPFMFLVDYEVHKLMKNNIVDPKKTMESFIRDAGLLRIGVGVLTVVLMMGGVLIPVLIGSSISVAFELVKGAVYYIVILGLMLPLFNIFITLTVARELARFFSVDVNFMSFLKII